MTRRQWFGFGFFVVALWAVLAGLVLAALFTFIEPCGFGAAACMAAPGGGYFDPLGGYFGPLNAVEEGGPGQPGVQSLLGIADLHAKAGDTVQLISATALGADPADVTPYVLRLNETHGGVGGVEGDNFGGLSFAAYAKPLAGFTFNAADGEIQVVLKVTSKQPGNVAFSAVDLTFQVDGGAKQTQRLPTAGTVCFGDPRPSFCP